MVRVTEYDAFQSLQLSILHNKNYQCYTGTPSDVQS